MKSLIILTLVGAFSCLQIVGAEELIDNSRLLPKFQTDSEVTMEGLSPEWVKSLVMAQFRIETATPEGTFAAATKVLDHYAEMGVNGLWINPIFKRDPTSKTMGFNGYGNFGLDVIDPSLTGTSDPEASYEVVKKFVDEAHRRNIRVFFDVVTWGVAATSPLVDQHEEWFMADGKRIPAWGGWGFNWKVPELREWYATTAADLILRTGADGLRCDLEPHITGYDLFGEIRKRLYDQGRKIIIISEFVNERKGVYDFEQVGAGWEKGEEGVDTPFVWESGDYYLNNNIVESIKDGHGIGSPPLQRQGEGGKFRYYTYCLLSHDSTKALVKGSRLRIAYQAIFAPFIPLWQIGEEWNNPYVKSSIGDAIYYNVIDWSAKDTPSNHAFFEDVKKFIQIRRSYADIFEYFPEEQRNANIVKVEAAGNPLQSYARFRNGRGILVIPNGGTETKSFEVAIPFEEMEMPPGKQYTVTDLIGGKVVATVDSSSGDSFECTINPDSVGAFLVEKYVE